MLVNAPATSGTNGLTKSSSTSSSDSTSSVLDTSHSSGVSVKLLHSTVQTASSSDSASPVPDNSQNSGASAKLASPSLNTSTSSSSPSPLSLFLKPLPPSTTTPKSSKGTSARVLGEKEATRGRFEA